MSRFLVLIAYRPEGWNEASPEQQQQWMADHGRFHAAVGDAMVAGEALAPPATAATLRHTEGRPVVTDGPFTELAEVIGGLYLIDAADRATVERWCELLPSCYTLEIRPCVDVEVPG